MEHHLVGIAGDMVLRTVLIGFFSMVLLTILFVWFGN